jgi:transcriptional regulator with XRE-family HTH domain
MNQPPQATTRDDEAHLLRLQDRFLRALAGLRRAAGLSQRELADRTGWHQPYVVRLEGERSGLIAALARLERFADACGATALVTFVDPKTGQAQRTLALGDAGARLLASQRPRQPVAVFELPDFQSMARDAALKGQRKLDQS